MGRLENSFDCVQGVAQIGIDNAVHRFDLGDVEKDLREKRKEKIREMYLACYSNEEIAASLEISETPIKSALSDFSETFLKSPKVNFQDEEFQTPIYNVWAFAKKTNEVSHFGNSEQRIVDNLLYLYTEPFDIVVDPFAGGGSTIDVCKKRLRRYYASDRSPTMKANNTRTTTNHNARSIFFISRLSRTRHPKTRKKQTGTIYRPNRER